LLIRRAIRENGKKKIRRKRYFRNLFRKITILDLDLILARDLDQLKNTSIAKIKINTAGNLIANPDQDPNNIVVRDSEMKDLIETIGIIEIIEIEEIIEIIEITEIEVDQERKRKKNKLNK
jgi:hypothetical protein